MKKNKFFKYMSERDKKVTLKNVKNITYSIIAAVIVWLVVINIVNPPITVSINDAQVRFLGENELHDKGFVLVGRENLPDFSIKVRGARRDLLDGMDKIRIDIDLSNIADQGETTVYPTVYLPSKLSLEKQKFSSAIINIEPAYSKEAPVLVKQINTDKLKDKIVESSPEKDKIKIYGSKSEISKVSKCVVDIDALQVSENGAVMSSYRMEDDSGNAVEAYTVYGEKSVISVTNTIYDKHTVPVSVELDNGVKKLYAIKIDEKSIEPQEVEIGVSPGNKVPDKIVALFTENDALITQEKYTLKLNVPNGVYLKNKDVTLKAEVAKKTISVVDVRIETENIPDGTELQNFDGTVQMEVSIPVNYSQSIVAYADLSNCKIGENIVKLKFRDENICAEENDEIKIFLKNK